jgi:hypothetical protein
MHRMILTRRTALALVPLAAAPFGRARGAPAPVNPPVPPGGKLTFSVWRQGGQIGMHMVQFTQSGDTLKVQTHAHFSVGLGPLKFFSYTYQVTELWQGGALQSLAAQTDDNGQHETCNARRQGEQLLVTGTKSGSYTAPKGSIAGTHWNQAELKAPMINPENGAQMHYTVVDKGMTPPPGGHAPAHQFGLTGYATLDIWYDAVATWVGLKATAKDKSVVEYRAI